MKLLAPSFLVIKPLLVGVPLIHMPDKAAGEQQRKRKQRNTKNGREEFHSVGVGKVKCSGAIAV